MIDYTVDILNSKQRSMYVDEIVNQPFGGTTDRDSRASVLAKKQSKESSCLCQGQQLLTCNKTIRLGITISHMQWCKSMRKVESLFEEM